MGAPQQQTCRPHLHSPATATATHTAVTAHMAAHTGVMATGTHTALLMATGVMADMADMDMGTHTGGTTKPGEPASFACWTRSQSTTSAFRISPVNAGNVLLKAERE